MRAGAPVDPNVILIETALIQVPLSDGYVSRELWQDTDELIVDLERREALNQNGLRVGQLVGSPPVGFQTLLLSPRCCPDPERLMVPAGRTIAKHLGPVLAHCSFDVFLAAGKTELEADQIRFGVDVVPTLTADGRTRLTFTPKVETGESLLPFQAAPEESSWVLRIERPTRRFTELSWDATLAPGQYLVIGCLPDRAGSFGESAFVQDAEPGPVQRLLVIRTNRAGTRSMELAPDDTPRPGQAPLAVQAARPVYDGSPKR
jgi:hypothetical protein